MSYRRMSAPFVLLITAGWFVGGCTTAAKQVLREVRGAHAEVLLINSVPEGGLAAWQSVEFDHPNTTLSSRLCPPSLLGSLEHYAGRLQEDLRDLYPGGAPTLLVRTEVLYFQKKGLLGAAQLLTRVNMYSDDALVVDALINARSKSFRAGAGDDLAEAAIDTLGEFLREQKTTEKERQD